MERLAEVDLATRQVPAPVGGAPARDLVHVDIKELGRIPDGGVWRVLDRRQGRRHSAASTTARSASGRPVLGYGFIHRSMTTPG